MGFKQFRKKFARGAAALVTLLSFGPPNAGAGAPGGGFVGIQTDKATESALLATVNRCCANSGEFDLKWNFRCEKKDSAPDCLQPDLDAAKKAAEDGWNAFMKELPPPLLGALSRECGTQGGIESQFQCLEPALGTSPSPFDSKLKQVAKDPAFNLAAAKYAYEKWKAGTQTLWALDLACERAQGSVQQQDAGSKKGKSKLVQKSPPGKCGRKTDFAKPAADAYHPTPADQTPQTDKVESDQAFKSLTLGAATASKALDPKNVKPGEKPVDTFFDAYDGLFTGINVECPSFLPRQFCGGGRFDPRQYRGKVEKTGVEYVGDGMGGAYVDKYETVYHYYDQPDVPLGKVQAGEFMQGVYGAVKSDFDGGVKDFLTELFMERYLQMAALEGDPEDLKSQIDQLALTASCAPGGADKVRALAKLLPQPSAETEQARARFRNGMALGAQCMAAVVDRWNALRKELALGIEIARPVLKPEELAKLPFGVRHLANGLTGLPILRHFLREVPWMQTDKMVEAAQQNCDFLQIRMNPTIEGRSRMSYCMNVYNEYLILSQELNSLNSTYPQLGEELANGQKGYQVIASAAPIDPRIQGYNLDINHATSTSLADPAGEGLNFCMTRLRQNPADKASPLITAPEKGLQRAGDVLEGYVKPDLARIADQVSALCDPKKAPDLIKEAIRSPELMGQYMNCNRTRFPTLTTTLHLPPAEWPRAVTADECRDRINSSWVACREFREYANDDRRDELLGNMLQTGMDALFFLAPGVGGFAPSIGKTVASMAIGGGIGYAMGPDTGKLKGAADFEVATYLSGVAPVATYEKAYSRLKSLAEQDPRVEAALNGAFMGAAMSVFAPGGPKALAETSTSSLGQAARTEAELLQLYYTLKAEGKFAGPAGQAAEQELIELFEQTLKKRFPDVSEATWKALTTEEKLAILEGDVASPKIRPGVHPPEKPPVESVVKTPEVRKLQKQFKRFDEIGVKDNRNYLKLAESDAGQSGKYLYFESENAILKQLNDSVIKNKDVVTAVSNQYKSILYKRIMADPLLKAKLLAEHSDFKAIRFIFSENTPEVAAALEKAYSQASQEFAHAMESSPLRNLFHGERGIGGDPASWHLAGIGSTADEAGAAARTARKFFAPDGTPMQKFNNVAPFLKEQLDTAERLRASLQQQLPLDSGILRPAKNAPGKYVLSDRAIEVFRKIKADSYEEYVLAVKEKFKKRFGVDLTDDEVRQLRDYNSLSDGFSSGILQEKRVVIDMAKGKAGWFSIDFAGQGARNIGETMDSLAGVAGGDAKTAVKAARAAEKRATAGMNSMKDGFTDAVSQKLGKKAGGAVQFTGDDGMLMPDKELTRAQKLDILNQLAKENASNRATFVPPKYSNGVTIAPEDASTFVVQAENIEKNLRSSLDGKVKLDVMDKVMIAVDLVPDGKGGGTANILLAGQVDPSVAAQIKASLRGAVPKEYTLGDFVSP